MLRGWSFLRGRHTRARWTAYRSLRPCWRDGKSIIPLFSRPPSGKSGRKEHFTPISAPSGAIDAAAAEANPIIAFILEPGGFHTDYFLNPDYFSKETSQLIQTTIQAFL